MDVDSLLQSFRLCVVCLVVSLLLECLKSEVLRAEDSLLLAAASYPLYGRAHCITAALQTLPTG